jgi:hypothetical protein
MPAWGVGGGSPVQGAEVIPYLLHPVPLLVEFRPASPEEVSIVVEDQRSHFLHPEGHRMRCRP